MNEEILRQAILAIAISVEYKKEEYERNVSQEAGQQQLEDPAFYLMNNALLSRFKDAWREGIPEEKMAKTVGLRVEGLEATTTAIAVVPEYGRGMPPLSRLFPNEILKALMVYSALELSWSFYRLPYSSTIDMLIPHYSEIVRRFMQSSKADMITELASRRCVSDAIRMHLYRSNNRKEASVYNKLRNSNRTEVVFDMFKEHFRERSATNFQFRGSFLNYIMHTYQNHFYNSIKKPEIWRALMEEDSTKEEQETGVGAIKYVEQGGQKTDLYIRDMLQNIGMCNDRLFEHKGHMNGTDAEGGDRGVIYDIVYLILCHLCQCEAEELNRHLDGFRIEFVDPLGRDRPGRRYKKNVTAKITNAKQLVPVMFEYIRHGNFSTSRILDLRRESYKLGRSNTQGRDPVWKSENNDSEGQASFFLDTPYGEENYKAFEVVFNGVASAYSILKAMRDNGVNLVEMYLSGRGYKSKTDKMAELFCALFVNDGVYRNMDYMSSLQYLPLMMQLQDESTDAFTQGQVALPGELGSGELLDTEGMVHDYAGSEQHTEAHIIEQRRHAKYHGLLDKPKLRWREKLDTPYEKKRSVTHFMTTIPYTFREFDNQRQDADERMQIGKYHQVMHAPYFTVIDYYKWRGQVEDGRKYLFDVVEASRYGKCLFNGIHNNSVLHSAEGYAKEHLYHKDGDHVLDWHIGTHCFPGMCYVVRQSREQKIVEGEYGDVNVQRDTNFLVQYLYVSLANFMCTTGFGEDINAQSGDSSARVVLTESIPEDREVSWLNENVGRQACYCSLPMCYDPHVIALAGNLNIRQLPERYTQDEVLNPKTCQLAMDKLKNSLGFELYIGVENLNSSDVHRVLDNVEVWQDYRSQAELYYSNLVELNWMQMAFVSLLELMFQTCWFVTLPDIRVELQDKRHAYNLFKSLLTGYFKRDDLNWFFNTLRAYYIDQYGQPKEEHLLPKKISNFAKNQSMYERREVIRPVWALLLDGPFSGWDKLFGLEPETKFDDGPYVRYKESVTNVQDAAEQFVMLHGFLYEKTLFLKVLRDCYTITFTEFGDSNNTLGCELGSVLNIRKQFSPSDGKWTRRAAAIDRPTVDLPEYIKTQVLQDNIDFEVLRTALDEYYSECAKSLQQVVNYKVASNEEASSRFSKWGEAMDAIPAVTGSIMLDVIRGRYDKDSCGFFFVGNDYFTFRYGGDTAYLHSSGHLLLLDRSGNYRPEAVDCSTQQKISEYDKLLDEGMRDASVKVNQ